MGGRSGDRRGNLNERYQTHILNRNMDCLIEDIFEIHGKFVGSERRRTEAEAELGKAESSVRNLDREILRLKRELAEAKSASR